MDEEIKKYLFGNLSRKRYSHSLSVAYTAKQLAAAYGVDQESCYMAGLLHDISKEKDKCWHLEKLDGNDLVKSFDENIYHAYTAKILIAEVDFPVDDIVINAIEDHIEGSFSESAIGKILYIADFIEPLRTIKESIKIRNYEFNSLDEMYATTLIQTYNHFLSCNFNITPKTIKAVDVYGKYAINLEGLC